MNLKYELKDAILHNDLVSAAILQFEFCRAWYRDVRERGEKLRNPRRPDP